jgi:3-hydroxybutyryl-CoA dehydrogenase
MGDSDVIERVGIVGGGIMGAGLAVDLAARGSTVAVVELDQASIQRSHEEFDKNFRLLRFSESEFRSVDTGQVKERVKFVEDYSPLANVDFVIENVTEDYEAKKPVWEQLGKVCRQDIPFAANTSCISITKLGSLVPNPNRVLGMHFMNPVPMKKLVEVIRGHHTDDAALDTALNLVKYIGKTGVVVEDMPGFVTNRILMLTINEAVFAIQDRIADPESVDKIFRLGFGHKMGPLATGDLIGLDTILRSLEVLYESYNDPKYRPAPLLKKMVDAGLLGRKSGQGFFQYSK